MNVFVLCTGRTGSATFAKACAHATNYSSAHESRTRFVGAERLHYPPNHIEVDNRLSWMLGRLYDAFGDEAFYVHLTRNPDAVAQSYMRRYDHRFSILKAYHRAILMRDRSQPVSLDIAHDYIETVTRNIELFLKDRPQTMTIALENIHEEFPLFWSRIKMQGDLDAALAEWNTRHNESPPQRLSMSDFRLLARRWKRILCGYLCD